MGTETSPILIDAINKQISKRVPDARREISETKADPKIANSIAEIEPENPVNSLKTIDLVIDAVKKGGDKLTLDDLDRALDASDKLIDWIKKDVRKEKKEAKETDEALSFGERAWKFVGGGSEKIDKARKEAKDSARAEGRLEKSRALNSELDETIDQLIINELQQASPGFALIIEAESDINNVLVALDDVDSAADSLSGAGITDAVDFDTKNAALNMAMEAADNLGVEAAKIEVEEAIGKLNRALKKIESLEFQNVSSAFVDMANMLDIPLELLDTGDGFGVSDAIDMMGAFQTMENADELGENAQRIRGQFEKRLRKLEKSVMEMVTKIRKDLEID